MQSRLLVNLILLAVIAILAAVAIIKPGKKEVAPPPLLAIDAHALTHVILQNRETLHFEKQDGQWRLTAPFAARLNQTRVSQLLDVANATSAAQYPLKADELAQFGLNPPQATLTLGDKVLQFGSTDPLKMRRYVRIGDTLHLVDDNFFHHLTAAATDYVDKRLLPEGAKIREIQLPGLRAVKSAEGKWIAEPAADLGTDLAELASVWATSRAIDVKQMDPSAAGDIIRIGLAEAEPIEFVILKTAPELVLGRRDLGLQYELTRETSRELLNQPKPMAPPPGGQDYPEGQQGEEDAGEHEESGEPEDEGHDEDRE